MRANRINNGIYDTEDILLCPVARDFPWRESDDDLMSPFGHEYVSLCPRLSVEDALSIADRVSFAA